MRNIIIATIAALALVPASAQGSAKARTYLCTAVATFELADDANPDGRFRSRSMNRRFTYEEVSGRLRWTGEHDSWSFETIQVGDSERAMKAVRTYAGSRSKVLETLHIATWEAPSVGVRRNGTYPFLLNNDATVYGGTCVQK